MAGICPQERGLHKRGGVTMARSIGVAALSLAACTTLPQPPTVLPANDSVWSPAGVIGFEYVPARAVVRTEADEEVVLRNRLGGNAPPGLFLYEPRAGFVHRAGDRVQWGAHVGWLLNGLEVRYLPLGSDVSLPAAISVGAQVNSLMARSMPPVWDARAQLSIHPRVGRFQGLLGAGLSAGRRRHAFVVPDGPLALYGVDQQSHIALTASRSERRAEGLIGVAARVQQITLAVAVQPFYALDSADDLRWSCPDCVDGLELLSVDATFGAAFTLTVLAQAQ